LDHICIQQKTIESLEVRVRDMEINMAVNAQCTQDMRNDIAEIKEIIKELPNKQLEVWEKLMDKIIESTNSGTNNNNNNNITLEIVKVLGKALVIIGTLTTAIIIIVNVIKDLR
jgi:hypothetical protein